ncbi:hypothetical protein KSP39_PZI009561 [Platanthera zijinensis]|uniref:Mechanosensitive channel protein 2/3 transmembrane domain-containing protein n=1 Tax=Platanthera zijinensis TaxID=2320716 RepID=A0AAP0G7M0_9ASPA
MQRNANNWRKSRTHFIFISYLQPILLWTGTTLICRTLDPLVLTSEASQVVRQRLLNFAKSLSTVLAFANEQYRSCVAGHCENTTLGGDPRTPLP